MFVGQFTTRVLGLCTVLVMSMIGLKAEEPTSVCGVLANLDRYRGKLVTVKGILGGGDRHGWYIQDNGRGQPCSTIGQHGQKWPPAIAVIQFAIGADIEDGPVNFESDSAEIDGRLSEAKRLVLGHDGLMISVTAVGELRSRKGITITRSKDGWYVGDGYGQAGQYPALLVLKTVKDARVMKIGRPNH